MKVALAIIGTLVAFVGVLFFVFKFVVPGPKVATTVQQATTAAPSTPKSATTDRTAQRIGSVADLVTAVGGLWK